MNHIAIARRFLEQHEEQDAVFERINKKYQYYKSLLSKPIILCGFSEYARSLILHQNNIGVQIQAVIDGKGAPEGFFHDIPILADVDNSMSRDSLCIICTNPYMNAHVRNLKRWGFSNIASYHLFTVCDKKFEFELRAYHSSIIRSYIQHYHDNKGFYSQFFESLTDETSRNILAKLLCYLFSLDVSYCDEKPMATPYFDPEIPEKAYESFYDLGGFTGDTLRDFLNMGCAFKHYHLFEPDPALFANACTVTTDTRIKYHNIALTDRECTVHFKRNETNSMAGSVSPDGDIKVTGNTIDTVVAQNHPPTCIKMDIEGGEEKALLGAMKTITAYKPFLFLSVEHKCDDIKILSELTLRCNPSYRFMLRCCTDSLIADLLLYAIPM